MHQEVMEPKNKFINKKF